MSKYQEITNLYNQIGFSSTPTNFTKLEEPPELSDESLNSIPTKSKPKKKRFMWDELLHKKFLASIFDFGLKTISPKWILQSLNVFPAELTSENIKSHLQKYRLNSQKSRDSFINCYNETIRNLDSQPHNYYQAPSTKFNLYPISLPDPSSSSSYTVSDIDTATTTTNHSFSTSINTFNPFRVDDDDENNEYGDVNNERNNNNLNDNSLFQQCLSNFLKQKELYDEAMKQLLSSYKSLASINSSHNNSNNNNSNNNNSTNNESSQIQSPPLLPSSSSSFSQLKTNSLNYDIQQQQQQQPPPPIPSPSSSSLSPSQNQSQSMNNNNNNNNNSISSPIFQQMNEDSKQQNSFFTLPSPLDNSFSLYGGDINSNNIQSIEIVPMMKQIEMHKQIKSQHDMRFIAMQQQNDDNSPSMSINSGKDDTFDFLN